VGRPPVGLFTCGLLFALGLLTQPSALAIQSDAQAAPFQEPLPPGERLLGEFQCSACHSTSDPLGSRLLSAEAPNLSALTDRVRPGYLRTFLANPAQGHPRNRMPDLLAALPADEKEQTIEELVAFLGTLGGSETPQPPVWAGGMERGRQLFHSVGCVACHRPHEDLYDLDWTLAELNAQQALEAQDPDASPPPSGVLQTIDDEVYLRPGTLDHPDRVIESGWLSEKYDVHGLAAFLENPLTVRVSGNMPDLGLSSAEALAIAKYLLRDQVLGLEPNPASPGLRYDYFEAHLPGDSPDWPGFSPTETGSTDALDIGVRLRNDDFGLRFSGNLEVSVAGRWNFSLHSDDGSWLEIDGQMVVDNGGVHAPQSREGGLDLQPGSHTLRVSMFEHGGGEELEVKWQAPGGAFEPIPAEALSHTAVVYPAPDAGRAATPDAIAAGRARFQSLGCVACHTTGIAQLDDQRGEWLSNQPALDELDPRAPKGCLAPEQEGGPVRIVFDQPADRQAVLAALASLPDLARPLSKPAVVARRLQHLNCYACHRRSEIGGPHPDAADYFAGDENAELGDEGRFPPPLTGVGSKLRESWLQTVLLADLNSPEPAGRVRPYLKTRMPRFGADNVEDLVGLLREVDARQPSASSPAPPASHAMVQAGHELAGTAGLGCIQCHTFGGMRSLGVTSVDLFGMTERLEYDWFAELLLDPEATGMETRMPLFWLEGKSPVDVLDQDPNQQVQALWAYLSEGENMMPPRGLDSPELAYELIPEDRPLSVGVFMRGVSPRTLAVGFPEWVHYAYDMQSARLHSSWRGRFFNTRGTWQGRAGALESPPSDDVLIWPPGATFAPLADLADPWPATSWSFGGRRLDAQGRPTLLSSWNGVQLEERPQPLNGGLIRYLTLSAARPVPNLALRVFRWESGGEGWSMPPPGEQGLRHFETMDPPLRLRVTDSAGPIKPTAVVGRDVELRVPVRWEQVGQGALPWQAQLKVEVIW